MFADSILKELINEQQLLKDVNLELKKKQSLTKLLFLSLNQANNHLEKLFLNLIQRQNRLLDYLIEENTRQVQRHTLVDLLQQVLTNENLLINKLKEMNLKLSVKNKKSQEQTEINSTDDSILTFYWCEKPLQSIFKRKSSSDTCLQTNSTKKSSFSNYYSSLTNIQWYFPKLERIKRNVLC